MRYAFSTYGDIIYDKKMWKYDDSQGKWREMYMWEAMFGRQLLDRKEFWETDKRGRPIKDENGLNKIDAKKVQDNQVRVFKDWMLMYLAGQFLNHRSRKPWALATRDGFHFYDDLIKSLEKIPGDIWLEGGEKDIDKIEIPSRFFDKADIQFLRKKSKTNRLYWMATLKGLLLGSREKGESVPGAIGEMLGKFLSAMVAPA